ncbi:MAG: ABC transporter permease, partial [Burkholderiaceae bacterium]|nr:ABC transporter permease [Burkholderiaceae bacterium]
MSLWSLALRNLLRNRRRSVTTLLAMVVGMVAILLFGGYRSNIVYGTQTGFVQHSGHLQIQHRGYFLDGGDNPAAYGIAGYRRMVEAIRRDPVLAPMLAVVTPTLQLGGIGGNFSAGISRSVMATGVVPEERNQMLTWNDYGVVSYAEPLPLAGTGEDTVIVGTGVARKLRLCRLLDAPDCAPAEPVRAAGA